MSLATTNPTTGAPSPGCPGRAALFGCLVSFVAAMDLIRFVRADLLTSPEPSWAIPRLTLTMFVVGASAAAGILAATGFFLWSQTSRSSDPLEPLPVSRRTLGLVALIALGFGALVRFASLDQIPPTIWFDEVLPIRPSLALKGGWRDTADAIRILPVEGKPQAFIGVVYLEGYRLVLRALGTTVFAIRFPGALEGTISIATAFFLGRTLLPRGGAAVAALALGGLRWQIILARFGWNGLALAPIADIATLLLVRARRRLSLGASAAGGLVAGLGAHVYLGSWIVAAALVVFLLWPQVHEVAVRRRVALALLFCLGFLLAASPIFLLTKNRRAPYFGRASDQNLRLDLQRTKNWMIPFTVIADSFQAPWLIPDPVRRQDLPVSRLGWIIGIPVSLALLRAVRSPRDELSALLLAHAGAAVAASLRWGFPGHPNGFRFLYLTTITAVAAGAGTLGLIGLFARRRRLATIAALGLLGVAAVLGARDALFRWGESRDTFDAYGSESTLIGRAEIRWRRYGHVRLDPRLSYSPVVVDAIREYGLDPEGERASRLFFGSTLSKGRDNRCFRITDPATAPGDGERRVEVLGDGWGREHAVVLASRCPLH
ncbi:MAG TPA: glycosyltransferase family 39 protein [Thermoanaerobaculia bacterium]|nr:glycosyltransferase family 39 protein [Thermoanaerobaculia bacterium]